MESIPCKFHINIGFFENQKNLGSIRLFQIGDLQFCGGEGCIPDHEQVCFEITLVVSGRGYCVVNGKETKLSPGDIHFTLKKDIHAIYSDSEDPLRYLFLGFDLALSHPLYNELRLFQAKYGDEMKRVHKDRRNIRDIFLRCIDEISIQNQYSDIIMEGILNQIICYMLQDFDIQDYTARPRMDHKELFVHKIISYVEENYLNINSVDDVSAEFRYSNSHISHIFSKHMNKTLNRYIKDFKLEKSLNMIEVKKQPITRIAETLGYSSIHSFSRAFKARYKTSPQMFIKSLNGGVHEA
jgi:AraC-like DNA-binding protein/uncharacterized cupin superfamily protein